MVLFIQSLSASMFSAMGVFAVIFFVVDNKHPILACIIAVITVALAIFSLFSALAEVMHGDERTPGKSK